MPGAFDLIIVDEAHRGYILDREMTEEEIRRSGANQSLIHVDFMIGTSDLTITGISKEGKETLLFQNGDWAPSAK